MTEQNSEYGPEIAQIAAGDQEAVAKVFERCRPRLRRMVQLRLDHRLQGRVDPSDILQEAYVEIARRAPEQASKEGMSFFVWLRLMTAQKLLEFHRRHLGAQARDAGREISLCQVYPEVSSQLLASQLLGKLTTASQAAIRVEQQLRLEEALNSLDPVDREVLTLRHFEELSNGEVAEVLGLRKSAASNRYVRALLRLKEHLAGVPGFLK